MGERMAELVPAHDIVRAQWPIGSGVLSNAFHCQPSKRRPGPLARWQVPDLLEYLFSATQSPAAMSRISLLGALAAFLFATPITAQFAPCLSIATNVPNVQPRTPIDIRFLESGLYTVIATTQNEQQVGRVLVE